MTFRNKTPFLVAAFTALAMFSAHATILVGTTASMDAFVTTGPTGNLVNSNYGGAGALEIANQSAGNPQGTFQSVLQFNMGAAASALNAQFGLGAWTIQSVTLQLTTTTAGNPIFDQTSTAGQFGVSFMQNNSWTEGNGSPASPGSTGITYSSLPSFLGPNDQNLGTFGYSGATSGVSIYGLSLTSAFDSDIESGGIVSLQLFAQDNNINYLFNSKNFGTAGARPVLTIVAVPEPATAALCLGGIGVLLMARQKSCRRTKI